MSAGSGCYALERDPQFTRTFMNEFQDRILYARDYFDNQHQEFINTLNLANEVLEKIYHANAEKLIKD
jgi:predicted TIM-barrel fold metal-dependent hydrolase